MAINTNTPIAPFGSLTIHRIVAVFANAPEAVRTWNNNRKTRIALHSLSDTVLRDIGLDRHEIDGFLR